MMLAIRERKSLHHAVVRVCEELSSKPAQSYQWLHYQEDDLWYELASCILGSRVSYEEAVAAARYLRSTGLLHFKCNPSDLWEFEKRIAEALSVRIFPSAKKSSGQRYRFPFIRANHIRRTAEAIYSHGNSLRKILFHSTNTKDARVHLVSTAFGIGPKQASLFLRNIGYADDLAILDRHVLQYMHWTRLIPKEPVQVHTLRGYEQIERTFLGHAQEMGLPVAFLDLAVWIVVRVLRRGYAI